MSRQAYLEIYGQEPPVGAHFGADVSWFQAANSVSLDSGVLNNTWAGLAGWAEYVCIRCSYGGNGDDGAESAHVQYADRHGYQGTLGGYHYFGPGASPAANASNYLTRSAPLADRFVFDMLDVEEGTTAGAIEETLDRISQTKQRECLLYSGKGIMDGAGYLSRKRPLWVAHYATRSYAAWHPTSDWRLWQAPYMPNQYGTDYPTCWQFTSFTANHGHLDLNVTTTPAAFGIGAPVVTPTPPKPPASENDMAMPQVVCVEDGSVYALDVSNRAAIPIPSQQVLADLVAFGIILPPGDDSPGKTYHVNKAVIAARFHIVEPWPAKDTSAVLTSQLSTLLSGQAGVAADVSATRARGEQTGAAIGSLPTVVNAAVTAAVKALPSGAGSALSPEDLAKVRAAVAEALESISIDVSATTVADPASET